MENLKEIKHLFMTYRNGVVADTLRKAGMPYKIIFGLQLTRIADIARHLGKSASLARTLWADAEVRESRLLACRIMPPDEMTLEEAMLMAQSVKTPEEADVLSFYLLRHLDFAPTLLMNLREHLPSNRCVIALERNLQDT